MSYTFKDYLFENESKSLNRKDWLPLDRAWNGSRWQILPLVLIFNLVVVYAAGNNVELAGWNRWVLLIISPLFICIMYVQYLQLKPYKERK